MLGVLFTLGGFGLIYYLYKLSKNPELPVEEEYKKEVKKYYELMEQFGYTDWQIDELIKSYQTLKDLRQVNKKMSKSLEKVNHDS